MPTRVSHLFTLAIILVIFGGMVAPSATEAQTAQRCFAETGFCIEGRIREFWEQSGGLAVFGLPIGPQGEEQIEGQQLQVQWFERNRLELHPENQRPYDVLIGRLGADRLDQQGRDWFGFVSAGGELAYTIKGAFISPTMAEGTLEVHSRISDCGGDINTGWRATRQ